MGLFAKRLILSLSAGALQSSTPTDKPSYMQPAKAMVAVLHAGGMSAVTFLEDLRPLSASLLA